MMSGLLSDKPRRIQKKKRRSTPWIPYKRIKSITFEAGIERGLPQTKIRVSKTIEERQQPSKGKTRRN